MNKQTYVHVQLLQGYKKILTYKVPNEWISKKLDGTIVTVPLRTQVVPALVLKTVDQLPKDFPYKIKLAIQKDHLPQDTKYHSFIKKISQFYFTEATRFYLRARTFLYAKEKKEIVTPKQEPTNSIKLQSLIALTSEQQIIVNYVQPHINTPSFTPTLIHGVTGSGKTEIYKKLIEHAIVKNKTVILMLPEVSLSVQFESLLRKQLPINIPIFGFHSAAKTKDKKILWKNLLNKKPVLIVGIHMPITLPIANLGLIIVDEEHEPGFQEKKHPKINSKELALWRAKYYNIPIVLGSATPSIQTLYNFEKNNWKVFKLAQRFSGKFPVIKKVMFDFKQRRNNFWITRELEKAIIDRLEKKEQTIIYLNRRGYSFFIQCQECGYTFVCPNCSVSLTVHANDQLKCHYCDHTKKTPSSCTKCKADEKHLKRKGIGTQQAVNILQDLFPHASIARADLDTTKKKREWANTVESFEKGEIDILVGTQTITKGYHFPRVTLVGILWADLNLHFPVFSASETTLQQLIQVSGRAGRQSDHSEVIVQAMHDHPIFEFIQEETYLQFYKKELEFRKQALYPPFSRLVHIELKHTDHVILEHDSQQLFDLLDKKNTEQKLGISILGPAQPVVYRIQKTEIRHIFLKHPSFQIIHNLIHSISLKELESHVFVVTTG